MPLLRIVPDGSDQSYALKSKRFEKRAKGVHPAIVIRCSLNWNPARAAVKTIKVSRSHWRGGGRLVICAAPPCNDSQIACSIATMLLLYITADQGHIVSVAMPPIHFTG